VGMVIYRGKNFKKLSLEEVGCGFVFFGPFRKSFSAKFLEMSNAQKFFPAKYIYFFKIFL